MSQLSEDKTYEEKKTELSQQEEELMKKNFQKDNLSQEDHKNREKSQLNVESSSGGKKLDSFKTILTKSTSHWLKGEQDPIKLILEMLKECEKDYETSPYLSEFREGKALTLIYISNLLEGTIPKRVSQCQTYELLQGLMHKGLEKYELTFWPVDGDEEQLIVNESQMVQHLRAYKYLCSDESLNEPLTVEKVKKTHLFLLTGAIDEKQEKVLCGAYRTEMAYANNYQFPHPSCIEKQMARIVKEFNESNDHFILRAAKLFYETLSLHPFINGNGRLCRLLFAYALMKSGVPFPVSLYTNTRPQKHYMNAITRVRDKGDYSFLLQLILYSLFLARRNYENNCRYILNRKI